MAVTFRHKKNVQIYKSAQHNYNNNSTTATKKVYNTTKEKEEIT